MSDQPIKNEKNNSEKVWVKPEIITIGMDSVSKTTGIGEATSPTFSLPS